MKIQIDNKDTREVRTSMIAIRYDYVPKSCSNCKIKGYSVDECRHSDIQKHNEYYNENQQEK